VIVVSVTDYVNNDLKKYRSYRSLRIVALYDEALLIVMAADSLVKVSSAKVWGFHFGVREQL
jgi:ethanolamine utilization microcompartment shell protein EutL